VHHTHIDRYAGLQSPVHALDARAKLLATIAFVFIVVLTPDGWFFSFGTYTLLICGVIFSSRVPKDYIFKRSFSIFPFALAVSVFVPFITPGPEVWSFDLGPLSGTVTSTGLERFASLSLKALVSFFATITLVATTPFGELMEAAGKLGLPSRMVVVLSFMYRYLFLIVDETSHMLLARNLRGGGGRSLLRASGGIVGALLVRSFEHADRLYFAMLLRGYEGHPVALRPLHLSVRDAAFAAGFLTCAAFGLVFGGFLHA
jgi:cobalt/nickel transport system permease protein